MKFWRKLSARKPALDHSIPDSAAKSGQILLEPISRSLSVSASPVGGELMHLCVSDGDTTAELCDASEREYRVTWFWVFVLTFAPELVVTHEY